MKNLIVGNYKMNFTTKEFSNYLDAFLPKVKHCQNDIVLCVPYTNLMLGAQKLTSTNIKLGAQNLSTEESGAYTGEISNCMLKELGTNYVIVGHSERRQMFKETDEQINKKIIRALSVNLKVILCIGETKAEKNANKTKQVITNQLEKALNGLYENELENIVIAYEPIWAIGSGKTPQAKEIEEILQEIRNYIKENFSLTASNNICILYGGSVNEANYVNFLKIKGINGLLVGGACLDVDKFASIVK